MKEPEYRNIAIIKLSALGDIIHTIPAFNILRKQYPQSKISWFVEPVGAKLLNNVSGIDEIVVCNLKIKGIFNKCKEVKRLLSLYRKKFDLIIDFQGLLKSAFLGWLLNGYSIGFGKENLKEPQAGYFYKKQVAPFDENRHVVLKNIHLVGESVSSNPAPAPAHVIEYPLEPIPISRDLERFLSENNLEKNNYLILNIGGGWQSKILDIDQYIEIINRIKAMYKVVILWGNGKERTFAREISRQTGVSMTLLFDFSELIQFIKYSRLVVTSDTLALHIADMVKKVSIGVFGPTSPWRNGSLLKESVSIYDKLSCGFCYKKKCASKNCIKKINIEKIIESIETIYEKKYD